MNKELISRALAQRLAEVGERVTNLDPQPFGESAFFVTSVKEALLDQPGRARLTRFSQPADWCSADTDCLTSLRVLSLHGEKSMRPDRYPPSDQFLSQLKQKTAAREPVFELLAERYAWPINFSFEPEIDVREYLLMRLMTAERDRIEKVSIAAVDTDELFLKLNLVGVHASTTTDLRFLDALNYYYELLSATKYPESPHAWLLVSWYALYARALHSWS